MSSEGSGDQVIIVGAGVVGIACAHYLTQAGSQVTVIDQGDVAGACSHGNCGYICPSHILPLTEPEAIPLAIRSLFNPRAPFRVRPSLRPALWRWMWEFTRRCTHRRMLAAAGHLNGLLESSMQEYRQLMADEALDCEWTESGLLYAFQSERGMRGFAETDRLLREQFGVSAERIEGADLPAFDPALKTGLAGAFHYPHDATVRPDRLSAAWVARLRERGVRFVENCQLKDVRKWGGEIAGLATSQGEMRADRYVFATGAWSARLSDALDCSIPVEPGKGYSLTMDRPEICPTHSMLFPDHKVGVTPFAQGYRLGSMMEFVGFDDSIPPQRIQQLRDSAEPYLVEPHTETVYEQWCGWRPMTWDSLPIIGRTPRLGNAYLATGHNMLGLSLAAATGRLLAELMHEHPLHLDPGAFSPARFN